MAEMDEQREGLESCLREWPNARCFLSHLWAKITSVARESGVQKILDDVTLLNGMVAGGKRARDKKKKGAGSS